MQTRNNAYWTLVLVILTASLSLSACAGTGDPALAIESYIQALSDKEIEGYYYGFCNKTIWPLFHYFTGYVEYDNRFWRTYERVNKKFADAVIDLRTILRTILRATDVPFSSIN